MYQTRMTCIERATSAMVLILGTDAEEKFWALSFVSTHNVQYLPCAQTHTLSLSFARTTFFSLSLSLSLYPSISLSLILSIFLSIYLSFFLSVSLLFSLSHTTFLSPSLSLPLSLSLSLCLGMSGRASF